MNSELDYNHGQSVILYVLESYGGVMPLLHNLAVNTTAFHTVCHNKCERC